MADPFFSGFYRKGYPTTSIPDGWDPDSEMQSGVLGPFGDDVGINAYAFASLYTAGKTLSAPVTGEGYLMFYLRINSGASSGNVIAWFDGTTKQLQLKWLSTNGGQLQFLDGAGTILGTGAASSCPADGIWRHVRCKVKIHNTTGIAWVEVARTVVLNLTGVNTRGGGTANNQYTKFAWAPTGMIGAQASYIAHVVHHDDASPSPMNVQLPERRTYGLISNGDGALTAWTPLAGTRWEAIDDPIGNASNQTPQSTDGDSTYISSDTVGQKNTVTLTNLPATVVQVDAVKEVYHWRKDDAGDCEVAGLLRNSGGTEAETANVALGASYSRTENLRLTSPFSAGAWTPTEVNGLEIGAERKV